MKIIQLEEVEGMEEMGEVAEDQTVYAKARGVLQFLGLGQVATVVGETKLVRLEERGGAHPELCRPGHLTALVEVAAEQDFMVVGVAVLVDMVEAPCLP